ncbi:hypothetical protein P5V15_000542 [Pogonomyrmex californicus]
MKLYTTVALITWAAFTTVSSERNIENVNNEKAVDYTEFRDLSAKQLVQPYVTDVEARSSEQTDADEDHSVDFANAGLSRSAVHADEEREPNDVSTTDSSSSGSIHATPLTAADTSIRLEAADEYPFREYLRHEPGYIVPEDEFLVENAGSFGQKVRHDQPHDETIVRTIVRTGEGRNDNDYESFQKPFSSTVSPLESKDSRSRLHPFPATREPFVLALKKESSLADDSPPDNSNVIKSETLAQNSDGILNIKSTTKSSSDRTNVASILENDVVPEPLPTPQARLFRSRNEESTKKSVESIKKSESVVRTSTIVEINPSLNTKFVSPIVVPDLPNKETQEMVDYMDDDAEAYRPIESTRIISDSNVDNSKMAPSSITTSSIMLNPLQVGITLVNADEAGLADGNKQFAADIEDYPQDDLQRLATVDKEFIKNNGNQSRIDYQDDGFERDEMEKHVEIVTQKVPDNSVEIQKSIELYHTAPIHEIHYPPEYIQQTTNLGVIETNNIGNLQRSKQPYDQIEQSELRPAYDTYQGNYQDEKSVIKAHASTLSQKFNRHEYNALEDDVGRPVASAVGAEYSSSSNEQTSLELQPFQYNSIHSALLAPNQFDDTLYDQSNVRHSFNGNDNNTPSRGKPIGSSTRQEAATEPVKTYVPNTYQHSVQQPHEPNHVPQPYDHKQSFRSPEIRRPEVSQLLLRIIPDGSSVNGGFLVPIPRPYPIEIEKKVPVEKKVQVQVPVSVPVPVSVSVPQPYPMQVPLERVVEKHIRVPHIYPIHIERVVEKRVPYTVQRLVVQPPSHPLHVRLPAAYPAYAATPIEQPAHAAVPIEKPTEKPAASSHPPRPYRADAERPIDNSGSIETRFTKYYQKPHESVIAGRLTLVPQPQSETNVSQFYNPYGRPLAYDYNVDVGKNYVPTSRFSNIKLMILPKKFGSHVILRPHASSYAVPSFGRQVVYNLVEKDKVKDEYVGPAPPRKSSQGKVFSQTKSPQFSTSAAQSLAALRKSRQPETHHGSFRQSKMEYGFKPPMVPSIQYDENTASEVEN